MTVHLSSSAISEYTTVFEILDFYCVKFDYVFAHQLLKLTLVSSFIWQVFAFRNDCDLSPFKQTLVENLRSDSGFISTKLDLAVALRLAC